MFQVYDVTEFMDDHPGGRDVLLTSIGKDATEDFEDVGHSKAAREQLEKYYIGEIDASTLSKKKSYTAPQSNQSSQASSGGHSMIKILQFLVPLMLLALALVITYLACTGTRSHLHKSDQSTMRIAITSTYCFIYIN
ncbi:hypothetical protein QQ045_030814 [Rhodiola kirilowii]